MLCPIAHAAPAELASTERARLARFPVEGVLFGSAKAYVRQGLEYYHRCERTAGLVQTLFLWKPTYIIADPAAIAEVLVRQANCFTKPYVLRRLKVLFGDGLLTSDGEVWLHHRRLAQPAFSAERLPAFVETVRRNASQMASSWRDGEIRDVYPDLIDLCMKNVTESMFGVDDEELACIVRALAATCHELVHAVFKVLRPLPFRFPSQLLRRVENERDALDEYLGRVIEKRRTGPPRDDLLGLMLSGTTHHPPLSRQAIIDESVTLLLAGHETTAASLVWALYLLALHPQEADALAAALSPRLQGSPPSYTDLEHLESLRAVLDETLRLYPSTHRIARTVSKKVVVGGHVLRPGWDVVLPQWAVHRSERWYQDPETFLPGRWTPSFRKSLPKFAYFPFSGGPRTCIGAQLAWCESAVILALLTQRYRFSLCDQQPLVPYEGLTLLPGAGRLTVRLEHRPATHHPLAESLDSGLYSTSRQEKTGW